MTMKMLRSIIVLTAVVWTSAVGPPVVADSTDSGSTGTRSIALEPCHIPNYRQEAQCGSLTVFENRVAAQGRELDIHFAILPAVDEASEPDPVVFFAGGPGQAGTEMAPFVRAVFSGVNEQRDIVLIDQRGMGASHALECDEPAEGAWTLTPEQRRRLTREVLEKCLQELDADVTLYTQDLANADIHDILKALGYERVNLYGVSWGTRSALLYAHQYPEHVRTLILDGSLPLANPAPLHAAEDAERALLELFDDCAADSACAEAFPDLRRDFETIMERFGPDGQNIEARNPSTGEPLTILLTRDMFGDLMRSILYSSDLSRLAPLIIRQVADEDYRGLVGVSAFLTQASAGSMTLGATLTIFCSEELARMAPEDFEREAIDRLLGHQMLTNLRDACEIWPKAPLPAVYGETVGSSAPALVLSGQGDPITPPRWGERMTEVLPDSLHLVAPATGHNVAPQGCAPDLMEQFVDQGNLQGIDGACLQELTRPTFFVDLSGPKAGSETAEKEGAESEETIEETADQGAGHD